MHNVLKREAPMLKPYVDTIKIPTKTDFVVDTLRTAILTGEILPGTRITEQDVRNWVKVSSSPVREAFHQLVAEGLLMRSAHLGTKVNEMHAGDAKELYFIQSLLQGTAVQIAAGKLSEDSILEAERLNLEMKKLGGGETDVKALRVLNYKFHMILCGASVYPWLTRLIAALWVRFPSQSLWLIPGRPMMSIRQHEKIIGAIRKGDPILAGSLMRKHLESSMRVLYTNKTKR
jgi:DNA-binding GntR family transcriptional regulator